MQPQYRELRLKQLAHSLSTFESAKQEVRPQRGWLRAIREALGITLKEIGDSIGVNPSHARSFEKAEAEDRITLRSLKQVAEAMGCELVYAVVPKSGTIRELAEKRARAEAAKRVLAVEHSMALENQATGNVEERINEETRRILNRS